MKVTREMYEAFKDLNPGARNIRAGLEAALADVPDVVPFAFAGYPDNAVYLHPCGTVVDVSPVNPAFQADVDAGLCDCEGGQPWQRIYVQRSEA